MQLQAACAALLTQQRCTVCPAKPRCFAADACTGGQQASSGYLWVYAAVGLGVYVLLLFMRLSASAVSPLLYI